VLQPSDHLCGPPLDPLQHIHVLPMLGAPELDVGLQVGSHKSGVKGQNHLPLPDLLLVPRHLFTVHFVFKVRSALPRLI